ncbi:type I restriction enzyme S subunit [Arcicella aurantiaca]|uniref:Type I restriction enzyme S subunit n=1 Tax=Arcicella aurantiaca TaxID=591202 RepID=A0A316EY72_9BACT|nr:restriction endonuclease subunit S [Arcicella aurantiaca]PWK28240.1 type I restriction enzyme S subunit [Arcicella aurantiaca]
MTKNTSNNTKELPNGWEWKKLGEVAEVKRGKSKHRPRNDKSLFGGKFPFIQTGDVRNAHKYITEFTESYSEKGLEQSKLWSKGTICLTIAANIGDVAILGVDACFPDSVVGILSKKGNNEFMYYFLTTLKEKLESKATKSAQMNLNVEKLVDFEIPLPPLKEQERIVQKLDTAFQSLDEAITLQKENIAHTQELKKAVLVEQIANLDCEMKKLGEVVNISKTKNPESKPDDFINYLDISSIDNKLFKVSETKLMLGKDAPSRARKLAKKGDIVFATTRPSLKNIAIIEAEYDNLICSTGFCILSPKSIIDSKYLYYHATSDFIQEQISPLIRGTQYPAISDKDLLSCKIPLPPLPEQERIIAYLDTSFAKLDALIMEQEERLAQLIELKKSVLQEAFEGKL